MRIELAHKYNWGKIVSFCEDHNDITKRALSVYKVKGKFLPSDGKFYLVLVYTVDKKYNLHFLEQKYKQLFGREEPFYFYKFSIWFKEFFTEQFLIFWKEIYGLDNNENI